MNKLADDRQLLPFSTASSSCAAILAGVGMLYKVAATLSRLSEKASRNHEDGGFGT